MHKKAKTAPKEHWEVRYSLCDQHNTKDVMGAEFNPQKANSRKTTYTKVNEQDH